MAATEVMMVSNREEDQMNKEPSMSSKSIVGLIIPPPEIRTVVEKTAQFVARNGIDFENKIKEKESNNPKFSFFSPTDPYYAFYRAKVTEYESGAPVEAAKPQLPEAVREHIQQAEFVPTHPPPPFEYTADPSTLNAFDLDLMRLTAMFVARNGRQFLTQLMNREVRNYQFDFLKPQHSNFPYFTKLVEQYTKVIIPAKSVIDDLSKTLDYDLILSDVNYRVAWEKHQRVVKDREDKALEKERMAYNSIDWHDFVVVQTVDFQPSETLNLPPLCTKKDVGSRILLQQRTEAAKIAAESVAMEMDSDSEDEEATNKPTSDAQRHDQDHQPEQQRATYEVTQPTPAPPQVDSALVRDYDPKKARQQNVRKPPADKYIISPLTNERISADKLHDHVRYNTVDPQYKEQRDREQNYRKDDDMLLGSSGTEISRNIARMAERRSDIFGVGAHGAEQNIIGKKLGEEEQAGPPRPDPRNIWDGQQSTIDATTRYAQQQAHQERMATSAATTTIPSIPPPPPSALASHAPSSTGPGRTATLGGTFMTSSAPPPLAPADAVAASFMTPSNFPPPPPHMGAQQFAGFDGPELKRARVEDNLEPEELWLRQVKGPITVSVTTPISQEWNLNGEIFKFTLDIKSNVSELKAQIQEKTTIPGSKQKLWYAGMYIKDSNSLAFYNMQNGSTINLQFKERGGRKK